MIFIRWGLFSAYPNKDTPRNAYVDIIKQLEPIDVKIIEYIYSVYTKNKAKLLQYSADAEDIDISMNDILQKSAIEKSEYRISIDNLIRLRLITPYIEESVINTQTELGWDVHDVYIHHGYKKICITCLGVSFVSACTNQANSLNKKHLG